jgi:cytochrome oxidase Cu insertion factor (SCO1/SenC/PrrC family)
VLRVASTLVLGFSTLLAGNAFAQPGGTTRGRAGGDLPAVGTTVPDVMLYDASGKEFSTTSLRGEYSVLVFGCLT